MPVDPAVPVSPAAAPEVKGKKTVVMDIPYELWEWAFAQARADGTNLTQKTIACYKQWRKDVETAKNVANTKARSLRTKKTVRGKQGKKQRN